GNFRPGADNAYSCGTASFRWSVIYSATALINTSDGTTKTVIGSIDDAEKRVAQRIKSGIKKFKFNDSIAEKGDAARIHWGVIAQDVKAAFEAEGLNAEQYAMFCSDTWFEKDGQKISSDSTTDNVCPEGATEVTRLGIRYEELLTFIIASM
ncbi:MAG: tail fiber domain-containing protein, partial [Flavobacteriia bacterium]|nr:tail fiber domain-containing protein [Flavobacteriia bacterium]